MSFEPPTFLPGWVWLTGAGPGDPGLLTLHAAHGLQQADVVLYDALVSRAVLDMARRDCERVYAGKRGGKPSPKQLDISHRLVQFARDGKRVLRLKGGDPFVFGRGGEEALALVEAGIPFRVIPGISAGIGALSYAGIPLTHRGMNASVTFLTGHNASGLVPDGLDWAAISQGSPTIVMYMALKHLGVIRDRLIGHGRKPDEPMAVIANATLEDQRVLETTLARCAEDVAAAGIEPPAIVVLGEVVRLRAGLDWLAAMAGTPLAADPLGARFGAEAG